MLREIHKWKSFRWASSKQHGWVPGRDLTAGYQSTPGPLWCWEGLGARGEGDDRGWDGWMASLTRWTWVWVNSGSWRWTGRPGVLRFMGSQRVGHDWMTDLIWRLWIQITVFKVIWHIYSLCCYTTNYAFYFHFILKLCKIKSVMKIYWKISALIQNIFR